MPTATESVIALLSLTHDEHVKVQVRAYAVLALADYFVEIRLLFELERIAQEDVRLTAQHLLNESGNG